METKVDNLPLSIQAMVARWQLGFQEQELPEYMWGGLQNYLLYGVPPGDFLTGVITNDLRGAVWHSDSMNRPAIAKWVFFFYNFAPASSWGSRNMFDEWCDDLGVIGRLETSNEPE